MASIITLQRWFRTLLQRRQFLRITWATETLQVYIFACTTYEFNILIFWLIYLFELVLVENDISTEIG